MKKLVIMIMGVLFIGFTTQLSAQEAVNKKEISVTYSKKTIESVESSAVKSVLSNAKAFDNIEDQNIVIQNIEQFAIIENKKAERDTREISADLSN